MTAERKIKGDIGAMMAMNDLTEKGYNILAPVVCEHLPFDFIAHKDNKLFKIQAKYSSNGGVSNKNVWSDKHGTHSRVYNESEFDYYAIYLPSIKRVIYPSIRYGGCMIRTSIPSSATPFWWWEDFQNLTDNASKHTYADFGINFVPKPTVLTANEARKIEIGSPHIVIMPSKEELTKLIWTYPASDICNQLHICIKTLNKWCIKYQIDKPERQYWMKIYNTNRNGKNVCTECTSKFDATSKFVKYCSDNCTDIATKKIMENAKQTIFTHECTNCSKEFINSSEGSKFCSLDCSHFNSRKVIRPSKDELEKLIWQEPMIKLSKRFGVSDRAIDKWCRSYEIQKPPKNYWHTHKHNEKLPLPDLLNLLEDSS